MAVAEDYAQALRDLAKERRVSEALATALEGVMSALQLSCEVYGNMDQMRSALALYKESKG